MEDLGNYLGYIVLAGLIFIIWLFSKIYSFFQKLLKRSGTIKKGAPMRDFSFYFPQGIDRKEKPPLEEKQNLGLPTETIHLLDDFETRLRKKNNYHCGYADIGIDYDNNCSDYGDYSDYGDNSYD